MGEHSASRRPAEDPDAHQGGMGNCCAGSDGAPAATRGGQRLGSSSGGASREERAAAIERRLQAGNGGVRDERAGDIAHERVRTETIGRGEALYRRLGEGPPIGRRAMSLDKARTIEAKLRARARGAAH